MKTLNTNQTSFVSGGISDEKYKEEIKDVANDTKDKIDENLGDAKDTIGNGLSNLSKKIDELVHKLK